MSLTLSLRPSHAFSLTLQGLNDSLNCFGSYFLFLTAASLPEIRKQSIYTRKRNFEILFPSKKINEAASSHSSQCLDTFFSLPVTPTCPDPTSTLQPRPLSLQPRSKDRFPHTQLHSLVACLRSRATIWKSHTDKNVTGTQQQQQARVIF